MITFKQGLRTGTLILGVAGLLSACSSLSGDDRALLEQTRTESQAAQAAADRAADAADRAAASAAEAADAASSAKMASERQERMTQKTMRK